MEDEKKNKHAEIVNKIAAVLICALGLTLIIVIFVSLRGIFSDEEPLSHIFFLFSVAIALCFSGYCVFVAYRIWSKISVSNVRRMSFVASVFIYFILVGIFYSVDECELWKISLGPILMVPVGLFYWLSIKYISKYLDLQESIDWKRREKTVKRYFGLLSFFLFSCFFHICINLEQRTPDLDKAAWRPFAVLFFSVVPAILVYRLGVRIALRNKPRGIEEKDVSSIEKDSNSAIA
jgi:hypothetical protein